MNKNKRYTAGELIISAGEPAELAYIVTRGTVQVFLERNGRIVTLAYLEEGSIIGESALFKHEIYGANVKAAEDSDVEVQVIPPDIFQTKLENCDPMLSNIIHMLMERQRHTNLVLLHRETQEYMEIDLIDT